MARTEVSGSQIKDSSVALSAAASPTGASDVTGVLPAVNGGTGLASPGASGNVLTSDGTNWTSAAGGGGGGGGSARVTSTVTSAVTLGSAANTEYLAYIAAGGSVTLPTAVGNTSSYTLKNIDTTAKTIATVGDDPQSASVKTLLQGNGDNNATTITDSALSPATWAVSGNAKLSTSAKKFGTASISFDGTNSNIYPSSGFVNPFGADFTIEMWVYINSITANQVLFDCRSGAEGANISLYLDGATRVLYFYHSSANRITGTALTVATWTHIALCRSGTSTRMFVNGTQVGSTYTDTTAYLVPAFRPVIGGTGSVTPAWFNGYMDDVRITSAARYTANFTAPTAELPLPQLIDGAYPLILAPNQAVELASNGSDWSVVGDADALPGFSTTPTSASTTTLTAASAPIQEFTGSANHTVRLPTIGVVPGQQFTVINSSSGQMTVQSSNTAVITIMARETQAVFTALVATPTTAANWTRTLDVGLVVANGKRIFLNNSVSFNGTDGTTMTFPTTNATIARTDAAQTFTGVQTFSTPVINGTPTGTGVATAATANTLVLRDGTGRFAGSVTETTTAVGTIGATTTLALAGTVQTATLTSNTPCTVTMPAVSNGASFVLYLRQPATGTPTTATFTGVRWGTGGAPVITAVLGRMDILTFFSDGTNWFGQAAQGFQY